MTAEIGELPNKLPKTKLELTSKRTKYSTRYLNPDGSFTEQIFSEPQFYQDPADKKWKKIDNNLKANTKKPGKHKNTANDFTASLADQADGSELVSAEKDGKSLALVPLQANSVKGIVKGNEITYPGLFKDTDVRYKVQGGGVKEDLILQSASAQNTFTYEVKLDGLKPLVEKDGTITFTDAKGKKQWFLAKPFMTDANGKYSNKVSLTLREAGGKTYVDVATDPAFLQNPATKYPVTIDPPINSWNVQRDMFVASSFPTSSYASQTYMETGYDSTLGATRSLVQFYLPALPSDSKISSATFQAYQTKADTANASVDLYRVTSPWTSAATWNTQPTIPAAAESSVTSNTSNAYWQWNITQLVTDWYNGDQANYGLMLKQQNETTSPYKSFNTVNSSTNTPQLTINYTVDPRGIEDFWSYTKDGVNPANGNLVVQNEDLSIPGRGVPISVKRTYNSRKSSTAGIFGYGWGSNLEAHLVDAGSGPIMFVDGDNTRHFFGQTAGGGYVAAGGLYLTLVKNADGTYTMTQMDGTILHFDINGWISSMVDTNGNTTSFNVDAAGNLTSVQDASGRKATFTYGTNGYVSSIMDPANHTISYGYDAAGNLTKVTDAAGNSTTFAYDARNIKTTIAYDTSDRVSSVSQPITVNGAVQTSTTSYSYDTVNLVTAVTDGEGRRVDYTTNANGNVVQLTQNPLDAANKAVTYFAYDNNNNLTQVKDPNTNRVNGAETYVYTYDANGNITSKKLPGGQTSYDTYDSQNNLVKEQDFNKNISSSDYDAKNNQTESTDANVQTVAQRYNSAGNLLYSTNTMSVADNLVPNSSFEQGTTTSWPDNWVQEIETGKTATYGWSSTTKWGKKAISISNPTGWAVAKSDIIPYAAGDRYIVSGYAKTANTTSQAMVKIDFLASTGKWLDQQVSYGLKGTHDWTRIQAVVENAPAGTTQIRVSVGLNAGSGTAYFDGVQLEKGTVLSAYNLIDNSSMERDANGDKIPDSWTTSNNLAPNADVIDANVNPGDDNAYAGKYSFKMTGEKGKNKFIKQHINVSGDTASKFTLSGWSKQTGADSNGGPYALQVAINNTDGTVDWTNANSFSRVLQGWQHVGAEVNPTKTFDSIDVYYYYYDQLGTAWFDAMRLEEGASHTFNTYDAGGNYVTSVKGPAGNTVSTTYDAVGNQTSATDGKGQSTSFAYDARNLLTKVTDAKLGVTAYGYDGAGNRTSVTDAKNNSTGYEYNEQNQVSKVTNPLNQAIQFGYDKNGNMTKFISPKGDTVSNTYNALNRMDSISYNGVKKWGLAYDANGNVTSVTDAAGKATTYTYDNNNRVTDLVEGASNKTHYVYDNNSNLASFSFTAGATTVSTEYAYNTLDQPVSLSRNDVNQASFVYDERGNVISIKRANGTYTAYEYDGANRLKSMKNYNAAGGVLDSYVYTYDANGNRTSVQTNAGTLSYQYDSLNQLTQETLLDGTTIAYEYDAVGNRTSKKVTKGATTTTTTYTYDAANELTAVNGQAYTYDANGNLTGNGAKTFIYNEENQLTQVKDSTGAVLASYTYDHEGKRTSTTTPSGTLTFHYNGDKVIYETDASNNVVAEYTWDAEGNPVTMTKNGVTYYYHVNGHGDVTSLTDGNGNRVAQYQYDAWGNILSSTGTMKDANPYRYAGYRYDNETGLYYLMARYYDASVGRFITRDTFHGFENQPLSLNQYSYVENNPVMKVDPTGHSGNFNYRWMSWGLKVWISHQACNIIKQKVLIYGFQISAVTLCLWIVGKKYYDSPKWLAPLMGVITGSLAWFLSHDKGAGVVIEGRNCLTSWRMVPAYK
ncbi:DNRLRE domain-containing protein [Aneurinibacillus tyrosinisolvens]|uniref:DNRLRE domain-containing protein n=1 Tax=Aneurinibacillus tyrosinisolvens TaxID=1443435 RepID=UPI00069C0C2F|nr:DNRLRE domain-containing protein [Aneurinibacillus tyrosinisolvens]